MNSQYILKKSPLFFFSHVEWAKFEEMKQQQTLRLNLKQSLEHILCTQHIYSTPIQSYLDNYNRQAAYVRKSIFTQSIENKQNLETGMFLHVLGPQAPQILKSIINKLDETFCEVDLLDEEKTDFSNAQTNFRRKLDQNFRIFREWLDNETNKNWIQIYASTLKQQELKMNEGMTALRVLVHIYHLKQIQAQEDFLWSLKDVKRKTLKKKSTEDS